MNKKLKETSFYQTTDFLICNALVYFDHELEEVDKSNPSRCIFNIRKKRDTEELIKKFYRGLLLVEPKKFQAIQKELKSRLYN